MMGKITIGGKEYETNRIITNGFSSTAGTWTGSPESPHYTTLPLDISNVVCVDITAVSDIIAKAEAQGFKVKIRRNKIVMKIPQGYFKKCAVNIGKPVEVK